MEHERMHHFATNLLRSSISDEKVEIENYEHFVTARKRLLLETGTLHHEIQEALYNLDPLTGTTSRIGMLIQLREQQELVKRDVHSCAVAMMDLDHFNTINGKYGHLVGDKVLIAIAESVMAHLRPYDKIFRCGGEEFLISLPNTDLQTAHKIIDRLREDLGSLPHQANTGATFHVAVSFGVTLLAPDISVEQSIYRADKALHVAKEMGRNRTLTWDASMDVL
jgi:diguanylate cyclase (GGDEF)-like protein